MRTYEFSMDNRSDKRTLGLLRCLRVEPNESEFICTNWEQHGTVILLRTIYKLNEKYNVNELPDRFIFMFEIAVEVSRLLYYVTSVYDRQYFVCVQSKASREFANFKWLDNWTFYTSSLRVTYTFFVRTARNSIGVHNLLANQQS